jgi:hypothetical protein
MIMHLFKQSNTADEGAQHMSKERNEWERRLLEEGGIRRR